MKTDETFKNCCRDAAQSTGASLYFKKLMSGKNYSKYDGEAARFSYEGFAIDLFYIVSGRFAVCPGTVWLEAFFDGDELVTFTPYDIFNEFENGSFERATFPFISNSETMKSVFTQNAAPIISKLKNYMAAACENGVIKNKLLAAQKQAIMTFCDNNALFEAVGMGGLPEKIALMCLDSFRLNNITAALTGGMYYFFGGDNAKAIKLFEKSTYLSEYEKTMFEYIKQNPAQKANGVGTDYIEKEKAVLKNRRRKSGLRSAARFVLYTAVAAVLLFEVYYLFCTLRFSGAQATVGTGFFNYIEVLPAAALAGFAAMMNYNYKKNKARADTSEEAKALFSRAGMTVKVITILAECVSLLLCFTASNNTAVFYADRMLFGGDDFSIKQTECTYAAVKEAVFCDGYYLNDGTFYAEPYYALKLKNGTVIELYDATASHPEEFKEKALPLLEKAGVTVSRAKSIEPSPVVENSLIKTDEPKN